MAELKKRYIIDNDGGDCFCAEGSYEAFCKKRMAAYPGLGATTLLYCPQSSGFGVFTYKTKYGTILTSTAVHVPIPNAVSQMIARGEDSITYALRFCREHDLEFFVNLRMNDTHDGTGAEYSPFMFQNNAFKISHPECLFGKKDGSANPKYGTWSAVDYGHPLVREMMCKFVEELCQNYDIDGVHLDYFRHPMLFRHPANGEHATQEEIDQLNDMTREIRRILDVEGEKRGRKILLSVRVPDSVEYALFLGMDLETWLKEGWLDLFVTSSYLQFNHFDYSAELGHRYGVPVYPSLDEIRVWEPEAKDRRNTREAYLGRVEKVMGEGCDGPMIFNYNAMYADTESARYQRETLRIALNDEERKAAPKSFFASVRGLGGVAGGAPPHREFMKIPYLTPNFPQEIAGKGETSIRVPAKWDGKKQLRIFFAEEAKGSVSLNGVNLGAFEGKEIAFDITGETLKWGDNQVEVTAENAVLTDAMIEFLA